METIKNFWDGLSFHVKNSIVNSALLTAGITLFILLAVCTLLFWSNAWIIPAIIVSILDMFFFFFFIMWVS